MSDDPAVYIRERKCKPTFRLRWKDPPTGKLRTKSAGKDRDAAEKARADLEAQMGLDPGEVAVYEDAKTTYHLRWICPIEQRWKNRKVGTNLAEAQSEAALLRRELSAGRYTDVRRVTWEAFVDEHCGKLAGQANRTEARRTLDEFSELANVKAMKAITFSALETFVAKVQAKGNTVATVNKKLRYLRAAFNKAMKRQYLARNPMSGWEWTREEEPAPRIVTPAEEAALLQAAGELHGAAFRGFIFTAVNTGARRSELLSLPWSRVTLEGEEPQVHFANTKGKRDRFVPLNPEVVMELRKLKASTQMDGGPFVAVAEDLDDRWTAVLTKAGLTGITPHDLRRTFCARLIRAGVPLPTVQKLAGHASIQTTLRYYHWVSKDDMREGMARLRAATSAG